jgi:hypothetical protein
MSGLEACAISREDRRLAISNFSFKRWSQSHRQKEISRGTARIQRIADDAKEFGLKERVPVIAVSAGILT